MRPGVRLRPADGGPSLQGSGSDRRPSQPFVSSRQRASTWRHTQGADIVPEEPDRGGPVHEHGGGGGGARHVRHGAASRRELCQVPERRGSGYR